jgi:hypothetical protein
VREDLVAVVLVQENQHLIVTGQDIKNLIIAQVLVLVELAEAAVEDQV